jgi:5-methylcytosine-specific restriction protein A
MSRLQTLKPRIQTLDTRRIATPAGTERIRGRALQTIRDRILRRDCGICHCAACQATCALKPAHEVDHRVPLWMGGAEDDSNRYAINADCHKAKTALEAAERARKGACGGT